MKYAKWSLLRVCLHNAVTVCNWFWPMTVSPLKSRNYRGDLALEDKFFKAITGEDMTQEKLELAAERIYTLHRDYTVKLMQTKDMRNEHDLICSWVFDKDPQIPVFTEGTDKMAKFFKAITGEDMTQEKLDLAAERIFTLHRAYTVNLMQSIDMRNEHDLICSWVFDKDPQIPVFTEGTDKMDRDDMHASLTMFYKEMGWDPQLGCPTRETLQRLGLEDIAAHNLLPA